MTLANHPSIRLARRAPMAALLIALTLQTGCAAYNYTGADAPIAQPVVAPMAKRPRVAVVLGSGGPRGYAHVGVIKVLEAAGIQPDLIVGSSVGALIGAFWASGMPATEIETRAMAGGPLTLFDLSLFADRGWIHGQRLEDYVNDALGRPALETLTRPLIVVATRRDDKQPVYFLQGNAGVAVRASSAIPNIFSPVGIQGLEYEDADETLPVAVQAARDAGAQFVIAVDVSAHAGSAPADANPEWLARDTLRRSRIDPQVARADFLIHPDMGYLASPRAAYFEKARSVGEATAQQRLPALLAALQKTAGETASVKR
jgi:NTE family protein